MDIKIIANLSFRLYNNHPAIRLELCDKENPEAEIHSVPSLAKALRNCFLKFEQRTTHHSQKCDIVICGKDPMEEITQKHLARVLDMLGQCYNMECKDKLRRVTFITSGQHPIQPDLVNTFRKNLIVIAGFDIRALNGFNVEVLGTYKYKLKYTRLNLMFPSITTETSFDEMQSILNKFLEHSIMIDAVYLYSKSPEHAKQKSVRHLYPYHSGFHPDPYPYIDAT